MKIILHADDAMASEIPSGQVGMRRLSNWEWELTGAPSDLHRTLEGLRPCSWRTRSVDDFDSVFDAIYPK